MHWTDRLPIGRPSPVHDRYHRVEPPTNFKQDVLC